MDSRVPQSNVFLLRYFLFTRHKYYVTRTCQITSNSTVCSIVCACVHQIKHKSCPFFWGGGDLSKHLNQIPPWSNLLTLSFMQIRSRSTNSNDYHSLKTVNCHDAKSVITGGTAYCRYDNVCCFQLRPNSQIPQCTSTISHYVPFYNKNISLFQMSLYLPSHNLPSVLAHLQAQRWTKGTALFNLLIPRIFECFLLIILESMSTGDFRRNGVPQGTHVTSL